MIKLFRKIRYKLMSENKTGKYFKYAIGEIFLVMIGILLALQVNNWNEARKQVKLESRLLLDVIANLEANKEMLELGLEMNLITFNNNETILNYLDRDLSYDSVVENAFHTIKNWHSPFFTYTAYESLKSKGLDIISNDYIKEKIAYMYEDNFAFLVNDYDKTEWAIEQSIKLPLINKHIRSHKNADGSYNTLPLNFNSLKKEDEFINLLSHVNLVRTYGIVSYRRIILEIDSLNTVIKNHLN
jgi:hypothetical protein